MRVALVHDALVNRGGAERVFKILCEIFPDAPIYTSVYLEHRTFSYFKSRHIITTPLQKLVNSEKQLKLNFLLSLYFMRKIEFKDFDLVLSSSTFCAKYVKVIKPALHICYCYTPFRLIWQPDAYIRENKGRLYNKTLKGVSDIFKKIDFHYAQKVDHFITMTSRTRKRIEDFYRRSADVVNPPINYAQFNNISESDDYYLVVSRLEPYKKIDVVIEAFQKIDRNLKIVGEGSLKSEYSAVKKKNIELLGTVSDERLKIVYAKCKAIIFPQDEDFGLVPLEANAAGKPVIALSRGGILDTMIPYNGKNESAATAIFFSEHSAEALISAIEIFESVRFCKEALKKNASRFDEREFKNNITSIIQARMS